MMKKYICPSIHICGSSLNASLLNSSDTIFTKPESDNGGAYLGGESMPGGPGYTGNGGDMNSSKQRGFYSAYGNDW